MITKALIKFHEEIKAKLYKEQMTPIVEMIEEWYNEIKTDCVNDMLKHDDKLTKEQAAKIFDIYFPYSLLKREL